MHLSIAIISIRHTFAKFKFYYVIFIFVSLRYWKNINKKLFFSVPVFSVSIIIVEILRLLYADKSFGIYTAISSLMATFIGYFVIVKFLINTDK